MTGIDVRSPSLAVDVAPGAKPGVILKAKQVGDVRLAGVGIQHRGLREQELPGRAEHLKPELKVPNLRGVIHKANLVVIDGVVEGAQIGVGGNADAAVGPDPGA